MEPRDRMTLEATIVFELRHSPSDTDYTRDFWLSPLCGKGSNPRKTTSSTEKSDDATLRMVFTTRSL